jgi:hypothetical protein
MDPEIQNFLEILLPAVVAFISLVLQKAHWSARVNTTIAGSSVLIASAVTLLFQHKLTGNVFMDFLAIATAAAVAQSKSFAPLQQWIIENVSGGKKPDETVDIRG